MADEMTPERARALLRYATPGPWEARTWRMPGGPSVAVGPEHADDDWRAEGDARLIAVVPDLARAYLAACEERDRLRAELAHAEHALRSLPERDEVRRLRAELATLREAAGS